MCPSRQSNGNLTLIFVISWCNYYKAITICENICPLKAFWEDKLIAYITLNSISFFIRQFYWGDVANFAGSFINFLFIVAQIIQWFGQTVAFSRRTWLLLFLKYFFFDKRTWWYIFLFLSPQFYLNIFALANLLL